MDFPPMPKAVNLPVNELNLNVVIVLLAYFNKHLLPFIVTLVGELFVWCGGHFARTVIAF